MRSFGRWLGRVLLVNEAKLSELERQKLVMADCAARC